MNIIDINDDIIVRKATKDDDLEEIAELIYGVDPYIYPYWFETLENCKKVLPKLLLEEKFIFYIDTIYIAIDKKINKIVGVASIIDKYTDLNYDYSNLSKYNERYNYVINEYIKPMIDDVKLKNIATVTNMCVNSQYRNMHIGYKLLGTLIENYIENKNIKEISPIIEFDVLKNNPSAIRLYNHLGFCKKGDIIEGFNDPNMTKPDVIIMRKIIKK